jgi:hypothetical protein
LSIYWLDDTTTNIIFVYEFRYKVRFFLLFFLIAQII